MGEMTQIFVYLPKEAVDVWRPVMAEHLHDDVYRISAASDVPDDEEWEFQPGDVVRCKQTELEGGHEELVATAFVRKGPQAVPWWAVFTLVVVGAVALAYSVYLGQATDGAPTVLGWVLAAVIVGPPIMVLELLGEAFLELAASTKRLFRVVSVILVVSVLLIWYLFSG
jgi:hypothetical protein